MLGSVFSLQAGLLPLAISTELRQRYYSALKKVRARGRSRKPPAYENFT